MCVLCITHEYFLSAASKSVTLSLCLDYYTETGNRQLIQLYAGQQFRCQLFYYKYEKKEINKKDINRCNKQWLKNVAEKCYIPQR
jgi:hypothetical protein